MKIFLHTDSGLTLEDVDETATVADVAENAGIEGATGWLEDGDDPLERTALVANAVGDKGHLHLTRCRRVEVTFNFAGKQKSSRFAPGATIGRVLQRPQVLR